MANIWEVFICSPMYANFGVTGHIRTSMVRVVMDCWQALNLWPYVYTGTPVERWKIAESKAKDAIYVLADDDCIPCPWLDLPTIENLFNNYPEFGILSLNDHVKHVGWCGSEDSNIRECSSVGGIRFMRKGLIKEWPEEFTGDDTEHKSLIPGVRCGYLKNFPMIHIGEWHSIWQKLRDKDK